MTIALHVNTNVRNKNKSKNKNYETQCPNNTQYPETVCLTFSLSGWLLHTQLSLGLVNTGSY